MGMNRLVTQLARESAASSVGGTDTFPVVQSGVAKKATVAQTRAAPTFTGVVTLPTTVAGLNGLTDAADDAAAATASVAVGRLYRTGSIIKVRIA
jgi:hypothetical protein